MTRRYSSTAQATTLAAGCTSAATSIQVTATTGFPAADFVLALDYGAAGQELVLVTNVSGTTLTCTRGYNSTPAAAHSLGAAVAHVHAAQDFTDSRTHEAATTGIHGIAGGLVGTTDTQALSNKDLSSGTNTFPSALATDVEVAAAVSSGVGTHAALTAAHGVSGAVVGTTDAQALTNKTIALGTNTVSGTTAQFNTANTDGDFATLAGVETLTGKTLASPIVTGIRAELFVTKTADESVTSSTVLQADDHLTVTIPSAGTYVLDLWLLGTSAANSAGDLQFGFTFPTGVLALFAGGLDINLASGVSGAWIAAGDPSSVSGTAFQSFGLSTAVTSMHVRGLLTASAGGTLGLLWSQAFSSASASTLKIGSHLLVRRIA